MTASDGEQQPEKVPRPRSSPARRSHAAWVYGAVGALLGVGAPAGALLLRTLAGGRPLEDLRSFSFFYLYELVGTSLIFAVAGFVAGRRADRLRSGRDRFQAMAERDPLTGLLNVETFRHHYGRAAAHAGAFGEPLAVLVLDVDRLKALNDSWGHSFGSSALLHVAHVLESTKRVSDAAARWGGDEFALLMPGAGRDAALRLAEQVLARLRAEPVRADAREGRVSVTIGIAACVGEPREDLFDAADRALYDAKRAGGNRIGIAGFRRVTSPTPVGAEMERE